MKLKSSSVISLHDLARIKNTIAPNKSEIELRKNYDIQLKEINKNKVKEWPNSLENKEKAKLEFQKMKFLKDEEMRRRIDEEEEKFQKKKKEMVVDKAKLKYFYQQDPVKAFLSKMRFSDMLQERKTQIQQSQLIKNRWKLYDQYWEDIEKKKLEEYDINEYKKKVENKIKNETNMKIIENQFKDYKRKKIEELQDAYVEGQIIKLNAQNELKEEIKKKNELKEQKQKMREDFKKANEEILKLKEKEKLKEEEDNKKIEYHARKKKEIEELRKRKEKEKFDFKQAQRQKLIDIQSKLLRKIQSQENIRTQRNIEEKEKEDYAKRINERRKKEKIRKRN